MQQFERITMDARVMGGKSCIRGMRVTVSMIVESLAAGHTVEELLADFPYLEEQDIAQALGFAAELAKRRRSPTEIVQPSRVDSGKKINIRGGGIEADQVRSLTVAVHADITHGR